MGARISKFMPITGLSLDPHKALPPIVPPPAPPLPAIPMHPWIATACNPASGHFLTGKWSLASVQTEGMGDIIHTYDWGPGQIHIPLPPVVLSPTMALLILTSSTKYWLPAFSVQEQQDGVFPGGAKPIAVSTPAYFVCTQNCAEPIPSLAGVCFQLVSTRWCAFTVGDLIAGAIGVVTDAVVGAISNKITGGNSMIPGDALGAAVANAALSQGINAAVSYLDSHGPQDAPAGGFGKFVRGSAGVAALLVGNTTVATNLLGPIVGDVTELGSNAVGERYREQPPSGAGGSGSSSPSGSGGSGGSGGGGGSGSGPN